MIESQFEVVWQKGEFIGPRSWIGRGITSAPGARGSIPPGLSISLPLISGFVSSSVNFLLP